MSGDVKSFFGCGNQQVNLLLVNDLIQFMNEAGGVVTWARDSAEGVLLVGESTDREADAVAENYFCLLYTSDAADE